MSTWIRRILASVGKRLVELETRQQKSTSPSLLPLTPKYIPDQHEDYVLALEAALRRDSPVLNVALSGSYGVGKSSILGKIAERHPKKTVFISLSSLGFPDDAGKDSSETTSKTNRIQKEIVKQILYSQDPVKMAGSRYRRMTRFRPLRETALAALIAVPVSVVFFLTGWARRIGEVVPWNGHHTLVAETAVLVMTTLLIVGLRLAFRDRIQVEKLTAGSTTISLIAKSTTYFDEYLDEIVYFFETKKPDIVIFEDIDRFDNAHIFETLRSLNTLLNSAQQLRGHKVRFIYAIKDSIFDELGSRAAREEQGDDEIEKILPGETSDDATEAELARANRTKFFDLVIPVVPFITHRSARDVLIRTLEGVEQDVSSDLIDLAARYVADMRLILDIRNEFVIFKKRIIDSGALTLSQDALLAMMLYKSTHLTDFEKIRVGTSDIDDLYRDAQALSDKNIRQIDAELVETRNQLRSVRSTNAKGQQFGSSLNNYLSMLKRQFEMQDVSYTFNGEAVSADGISTDSFWQTVVAVDAPLAVSYSKLVPSYGQFPMSLTIPRSDLSRIVGDSLESEDWRHTERHRLEDAVQKLRSDRLFLVQADMNELIARPEFKLEVEDESLSLLQIASKRLKSDLAVELVKAGYVDRNYTLYTSTFYTQRVSANAMNFLMKNVDRNTANFNFLLSGEEVDSLIRERAALFLGGQAAYNVSVLDHLLATDTTRAQDLLSRLTYYGQDEQDLLRAFMQTGSRRPELVRMLARFWPRTFLFLFNDAGLDDESLLALVDTALHSLSNEVTYDSDEKTAELFHEIFDKLTSLTDSSTPDATALLIANFMLSLGFLVPVLSVLSATNRHAAIMTGDYTVTRENLLVALGDSAFRLSLDAVAAASDPVYRRVLADLPALLDALGDNERSIDSAEAFIGTLTDVASVDETQLPPVIGRSDTDCIVDKLTEVPQAAWQALAEHGRFPTTFTNVQSYVEEFGIDSPIAGLLTSTSEISSADDASQESRLELAEMLLKARDVLPQADLRGKLIDDLHLDSPLAADAVPQEEGRLVGALLERGLVADTAETFGRLAADDFAGFEFAASQSRELQGFLNSSILPAKFVENFAASSAVPQAVKVAAINQYTVLIATAPKAAIDSVLKFVGSENLRLPIPVVTDMAQQDAEPDLVLTALQLSLADAVLADLSPILQSLGGEYEKLIEANGKRATLPDNEPVRALARRLEELQVVNSMTEEDGQLKVNMKRS